MSDFAVGLTVDTRDFMAKMSDVERKQLPFSTVMALNDTAKDILDYVQNQMDVVFDRPTRFTKNAFMVWRANKRTLEARVQERPSVGARHYLKVQERGGARPATGLERFLSAAVDGVPIEAVVPAAGARVNAFGNWSPSEIRAVGAALKGGGGSGRAAYFARSGGVYKRTGKGKREKITKVAHFLTAAPDYQERLGFFDGAQEVFDARFAPNFARAFEKAMATAR